jgi:chromosome segregation ATPase
MLVKFEEDEKKKVPAPQPSNVDINHLSTQAGMMEAQIDQEKYTPTKEELEKLEDELRKLNEQKFGALQPEIVENYEVLKDELSDWDTTLMDGLEDESNLSDSEKKRLSYVRSHG